MISKNKLLSILTVLIANPAYAAMDCKTPPDCATLGFSKSNVANCASDGYMYCPFDTSYKKCVKFTNTLTCPDNATSCTLNVTCPTNLTYIPAVNSCEKTYYNCEDAGLYPTDLADNNYINYCEDGNSVYGYDGQALACYDYCEANSSASCGALGYSDSGCSSTEIGIDVDVSLSSGDTLHCYICVPEDEYHTASLMKPDAVMLANISDEQCRQKYVKQLAAIDIDDCVDYI